MSNSPCESQNPDVLISKLKRRVEYHHNESKKKKVKLQFTTTMFVKAVVACKSKELVLEYLEDNEVYAYPWFDRWLATTHSGDRKPRYKINDHLDLFEIVFPPNAMEVADLFEPKRTE